MEGGQGRSPAASSRRPRVPPAPRRAGGPSQGGPSHSSSTGALSGWKAQGMLGSLIRLQREGLVLHWLIDGPLTLLTVAAAFPMWPLSSLGTWVVRRPQVSRLPGATCSILVCRPTCSPPCGPSACPTDVLLMLFSQAKLFSFPFLVSRAQKQLSS